MRFESFYNRHLKRWVGFVLALALLALLWPVYVLIALAVALDDGLPVFYRPQRGGYRGRPFRIFKFRTMVKNADRIGGDTTKLDDPRITRVGNFLRKTKLDEIPQLFNILAGSMSFIGPRPEHLRYVDQYRGEQLEILQVRPGITDFSSIEFINLDEIVGSGDADAVYEQQVLPRKNELRVRYAREVSPAVDARLFGLTVWGVIVKSVKFIWKK